MVEAVKALTNELIDKHFVVGHLSVPHTGGQALSCRLCGSFVWDLGLHLMFHDVVPEGWSRYQLPEGYNPEYDDTYVVSAEKDPEGESLWSRVCPDCEGVGYQEDPTACGDPEHCSPMTRCWTCNPWKD